MLYHLKGELVACEMPIAVIDCGGVGYKLYISANTLGKLAGKLGDTVRLFTHLKISEDAIDLYGFFDEEELDIFRMLISVSGVGAKSAISILSLMTPAQFAVSVAQADAKAIAKAQGIGAKTAQRIILELKDKISNSAVSLEESAVSGIAAAQDPDKLGDAIDTLLVLGYSRREATAALNGIDLGSLELEEVIRLALKKLVRN